MFVLVGGCGLINKDKHRGGRVGVWYIIFFGGAVVRAGTNVAGVRSVPDTVTTPSERNRNQISIS